MDRTNFLIELLKIGIGCSLLVGGLALEILWLAFCFGSVVIGIVMLLWFPHLLLFPFSLIATSGWRLLMGGLSGINPINVRKVAAKISPIIRPQIEAIEGSGDLTVPFNSEMLAYIAALLAVADRRASLSLLDVINVASTFFPASRYKYSVQNLHNCVDYRDNLKGFWESSRQMVPAVRQEWGTGKGRVLVSLAQKGRQPQQASATAELDAPF